MTKNKSTQKRPFYKKWWFWVIIILAVLGTAGGGGTATDSPSTVATEPPQVTRQLSQPAETVDVVGLFIDRYNSAAAEPITEVSELDMQGDDYRTEYRLQSFDDAVGKKGTIGSGTIEVINYRNSIRIYATADTEETANIIISVVIGIIDESVTDDDISENLSHSNSIVLGKGGTVTGYRNKINDGSYEIMVDGSATDLMK